MNVAAFIQGLSIGGERAPVVYREPRPQSEDSLVVIENVGGNIGFVERRGNGAILTLAQIDSLRASGHMAGEYTWQRQPDGRFLVMLKDEKTSISSLK